MKHKWIQKNSSNKLIIFFNGWGCDQHPFRHLKSDKFDVLMLYNYQALSMNDLVLKSIKSYTEVVVVAWSYGVWVAQFVWEKYSLFKTKAIAINGTTQPIDDLYGIPIAIVQGTYDCLSERNLMKFQRRMLGGSDVWNRFEADKPQRSFEEQKQELSGLIEHFKQKVSSTRFYDKAIIGLNDLIFITANQKLFWCNKAVVQEIEAPHFCFYNYDSWDEITETSRT